MLGQLRGVDASHNCGLVSKAALRDGDAHPAQVVLITDVEAADWLTATAAGES